MGDIKIDCLIKDFIAKMEDINRKLITKIAFQSKDLNKQSIPKNGLFKFFIAKLEDISRKLIKK